MAPKGRSPPPPLEGGTKRPRISTGSYSEEQEEPAGTPTSPTGPELLPPDLWADVLSFVSFDDGLKQCTAVNRFFMANVAPRVAYEGNFTLNLITCESALEKIEGQESQLFNRFRGKVRRMKVSSGERTTLSISELSKALRYFGGLDYLAIVGLGDYRFNTGSYGKSVMPIDELKNCFAPVNTSLRELSLQRCCPPLGDFLPVISTLRGLIRFELYLCEFMWDNTSYDDGSELAFGRSIRILESLPNLRVLCLVDVSEREIFKSDSNFVIGFCQGMSRIKSVRVLNSNLLFDWGDRQTQEAIAGLITDLENLEELSFIDRPEPGLWEKVAARALESRLKKLGCSLVYPKREEVETFVHAILHNFPFLTTLAIALKEVHPNDEDATGDIDLEETMKVLARLKQHSNLRSVEIMLDKAQETGGWTQYLQSLVGDRIQVKEGGNSFMRELL